MKVKKLDGIKTKEKGKLEMEIIENQEKKYFLEFMWPISKPHVLSMIVFNWFFGVLRLSIRKPFFMPITLATKSSVQAEYVCHMEMGIYLFFRIKI